MSSKVDRKVLIGICLDEIESALNALEKRGVSKVAKSRCRGWVKKHKEVLKTLKYRGKIARKSRVERD